MSVTEHCISDSVRERHAPVLPDVCIGGAAGARSAGGRLRRDESDAEVGREWPFLDRRFTPGVLAVAIADGGIGEVILGCEDRSICFRSIHAPSNVLSNDRREGEPLVFALVCGSGFRAARCCAHEPEARAGGNCQDDQKDNGSEHDALSARSQEQGLRRPVVLSDAQEPGRI